jgi:hypothetical protein
MSDISGQKAAATRNKKIKTEKKKKKEIHNFKKK